MLLYQKVRHILDEDKNGSGEVSDKEVFAKVQDVMREMMAQDRHLIDDATFNTDCSRGNANADTCETIVVGDVVRAKPPGDEMMYEGIVYDVRSGNYCVHFGDDEEPQWCKEVQRVIPWHCFEEGDLVQAQPPGESIMYDATVVHVNFDGSCDVIFDGESEDDLIKGIPQENLRKRESGRLLLSTFQRTVRKLMIIGKWVDIKGQTAN